MNALRSGIAAALVLGALVLLVHGPALEHGFHLEDRPSLLENPRLAQPPSPGRWFRDPTLAATDPRLHETRPLAFFIQAVGLRLWAHDPRPWHATQLVLLALVALLAFAAGRSLLLAGGRDAGEADLLAGGAAVLFVTHSLATTWTNLVWTVDGLLAGGAVLAAIAIQLYHARDGRGPGLLPALFILVAGSAQLGALVAVPLLLLIAHLHGGAGRFPYLVLGLVVAVTLVSRSGSLPSDPAGLQAGAHDIARGISRIVAPRFPRLSPPAPSRHPGEDPVVIALATTWILAAGVLLAIRRRHPEVAVAGLGLLLASLARLQAADPPGPGTDRFLVLPLAMGSLLAVLLLRSTLRHLATPSRVPFIVVVLLLALEQGLTSRRDQAAYDSPVSLWTRLATESPADPVARIGQAVALEEAGRPGEALAPATEAVRLAPERVGPRLVQARLLEGAGRIARAWDALNAAVMAAPDDPAVLRSRGGFRWRHGDTVGAQADLERAHRAAGGDPGIARELARDIARELARVWARLGRSGAAADLLRSTGQDPDLAETWVREDWPDSPGPPLVPSLPGQAATGAVDLPLVPGYRLGVFASGNTVTGIVALDVDPTGRVFLARTRRVRSHVPDVRYGTVPLEADLRTRTVEERLTYLRETYGSRGRLLAGTSEAVQVLEDADGDGVAEKSLVLAEGFDSVVEGVGSGICALRGRVIYGCIPHLWEVGTTSPGAGDRRSLVVGFGVRFGFSDHALHGVVRGPDDRIYFTMGDQGASAYGFDGSHVHLPDEGAVYRCNRDGTRLQLVHRGLRNPQDLVFDDDGNLFTADNNADQGDPNRLVQVVEGGDSGWRTGYQFPRAGPAASPWIGEDVAAVPGSAGPLRAAAFLPPVAALPGPPAGLAADPGTGFPEEARGRMYVCEFRGDPSRSGIRWFRLAPRGAGFQLAETADLVRGILPTDLAFDPRGALLVADWGAGFSPSERGRILRLTPRTPDPVAEETAALLRAGPAGLSGARLVELLDHPDRRVRSMAHLHLGRSGPASLPLLAAVLSSPSSPRARIHALHAAGILGRTHPPVRDLSLTALGDPAARVRLTAARVLADTAHAPARAALEEALTDPAPPVRYHAARGLGLIGHAGALPALVDLLRREADGDPILRHGAALALSRIPDRRGLDRAGRDPSPAVRRGVLLAARLAASPRLAVFLTDPEPSLVLEAARAIHDLQLAPALPHLADRLEALAAVRPPYRRPLARRAIQAALRVGGPENARRLARLVKAAEHHLDLRQEALSALADWASPPPRDLLTGRPLAEIRRAPEVAARALSAVIDAIMQSAPDPLRGSALRTLARLGAPEAEARLREVLADPSRALALRRSALDTLTATGAREGLDVSTLEALEAILRSPGDPLRDPALASAILLPPERATPILTAVLEDPAPDRVRAALSQIPRLPAAATILGPWLARLEQDRVDPAVALDVLEAAREIPDLAPRVAAYERPPDRPWNLTLSGGDPREGERLFHETGGASCARCHRVGSRGGTAGPDLSGVGSRRSLAEIREAILDPARDLTPGYTSPMPGGYDTLLTPRELRDLLAFLASR